MVGSRGWLRRGYRCGGVFRFHLIDRLPKLWLFYSQFQSVSCLEIEID